MTTLPPSRVAGNIAENDGKEGIGAGNETRTRDPDLGKVVLYQLSYSRIKQVAYSNANRMGVKRAD